MRTYTLSVPLEQYENFLAHGWTLVGMDKDHVGQTIVSKAIDVHGDDGDRNVNIELPARPQLLQRAQIRRPLGKYRDARFFDAVSLDYMGEDFEQASPESLRRMYHTSFAYDTFKAENLYLTKDNRSYALRLFTRFRGKELEQYVTWLSQLRGGEYKMRRPSGFTLLDFSANTLPSAPDLWWDVKNDVIFSFDKNFMTRLPEHLAVSFSMMDGTYSAGSIRRAS